ncbi:dihydrolipoyllysine-residue succinyltransferase [Thiocapsa imhoffii]|uniref:Dihydrolipoyllysine-residue succinyltransferase component of 2-oxoglutarate dehydrogenase complex n=1 Tax=Thiocapsa imhoffii TaxID=382777 RepID=A0A9X1B8W9_9GAMM|nr:2-oxoglutarate dehydrogenase complex dihydrolipoyllysine-residue succinyltransferase [Thiocapsa imhoffii]MBK1644673.1 dihydrolipoyllysine-residue succinyltransferase [Thiocapsa imhoffii]
MSSEVRVPNLPESVADATVATWHKRLGDPVKREENLVDLETDKVILEVPAPADGILSEILAEVGDLVQSDGLLARIAADTAARTNETAVPSPSETAARASTASAPQERPDTTAPDTAEPQVAPAARRLIKELNLDARAIAGTGREGRIHKADVMAYLDQREAETPHQEPDAAQPSMAQSPSLTGEAGRPEQRVTMTRLRARIAERLVQAQQNAVMLTTFNEVDLAAVMALRSRYKEAFETTHGVRLGLMSFFVKAAIEALQRFPVLNASVDGDDIIYHGYYDIGIAVSSPRGLVVPILRNCDQLSMADIEQGIVGFGEKARDGTLSYEELTGGTFSITNGGVFGSLLSTPILNPPQSAILGMHKIQERPVVIKGEIKIAPMMYLALTYDHRIIDGREAVQFLGTIKDTLEDPARLLLRI